MAILIIEQNGSVEGANLAGRVLIGRKSNNHIVIPEPTVSRIHAWIDTANGRFCVTDTGSRTGTWVNERLLAGKRPLSDGDQIRIGTARLTFRTSALPDGVVRREFSNKSPADMETQGILFDCACGAPLWVTVNYAGKTGRCRHCGRVVRVPSARTRTAQAAGKVPVGAGAAGGNGNGHGHANGSGTPAVPFVPPGTKMCGICQSAISVFEDTTDCPSCGLRFHSDCWQENHGCSAYGCDQVNILKTENEPADDDDGTADVVAASAPAKEIVAPPARKQNQPRPATGKLNASAYQARGTLATFRANDQAAANAATIDEVVIGPGGEGKYPQEHILLAASVFALLASALTWGIPAAGVCVWIISYLRTRRGKRKPGIILVAAMLALFGAALGVVLSYLWWVVPRK